MKQLKMYFSCLLFAALLTNISYAQSSIPQDQTYPKILENKSVSERLHKDWKRRNAAIQNIPLQWFELEEGYYASYEHNNGKYMALYDQDGHYIQTYKKADWNNAAPSIISAYNTSDYKTMQMLSYWEVYDADKMGGYYMELADNQRKITHVWINDVGQFSTTIPKFRTRS